MKEFAIANPGYTFLIVWVLAWAVTRPFWIAFKAYNRSIRARNIAMHGWPTAPVDADGDVIYQEHKNDNL